MGRQTWLPWVCPAEPLTWHLEQLLPSPRASCSGKAGVYVLGAGTGDSTLLDPLRGSQGVALGDPSSLGPWNSWDGCHSVVATPLKRAVSPSSPWGGVSAGRGQWGGGRVEKPKCSLTAPQGHSAGTQAQEGLHSARTGTDEASLLPGASLCSWAGREGQDPTLLPVTP